MIFTGSSVLVGVAVDPATMIAARALQGVGSAIVAPTSLALLTATFEEGRERTRAVALYAAVAGIGASVGLVVGGAAVELVSWRAGFLLNVPMGAVMLALAVRYIRELPRTPGRFDLLGAVTSTLGMGALIFGIVNSGLEGWGAPATLTGLGAGVLLLAVFVINEWRVPQPIMPLRLFASPVRTGSLLVRLLFMGAFIGFFYFTTQYFQTVLGWSPLQAGFGFLPMTVVNFAVAMVVTQIAGRVGTFTTLALGVGSTFAGMAWLSFLTADSSFLFGVALPMALIGAGQGLALAPMTGYGLHGVTGADAGAASGLINTAQQLGLSLGLAALVALGANASAGATDEITRTMDVVSAGLTGAAGLLAMALVVTFAVVLPGAVRVRDR
ncbi:MFS transporter [Rhodococcus sp. NPDC127530]|uniref:MFS transporter n=1 Tax=unclassified Rhodococcus (in: high G+C Gram-positive bacteria) TaxID=192944 RepID=UPI00362B0E44